MLAFHRCVEANNPALYREIVQKLDSRIFALTGQAFRTTSFRRSESLSAYFGLSAQGGIWLKDETQNPGGSHKGRHLLGVMVELLVDEALQGSRDSQRPLAIASCGNAALAAAVIARAADRSLLVFIPPDAEPKVVQSLRDLGAQITICHRREGESGDPCYLRFGEAVSHGAIPFCCQGPDNGLTVEGGQTLMAEALSSLHEENRNPSRIMVQVGGGALAASCALAVETALTTGILSRRPRFDTVQTAAAAPLARAYARLKSQYGSTTIDEATWHQIAAHKKEYMWPWESVPHSAAHGILDDETYDYLVLLQAMNRSEGSALVASEADILAACDLAQHSAGYPVSATGSAGLAGLLTLHSKTPLSADENVVCLFTGVMR
jgi:threonine synthase